MRAACGWVMRVVLAGALASAAAHQAGNLTLEVLLPQGFPDGPAAAAVVCREGAGRWRGVEWQAHPAPPAVVAGPAGSRCRVLIRPAGAGAYLASDEIVWDARARSVRVQPAWLRSLNAPPGVEELFWVGVADVHGVECDATGTGSRCLFVPADVAGVIVAPVHAGVLFALVSRGAGASVAWRATPSGRLLRVRAPGPGAVTARAITIQRALKQGAGQLREARAAPAVGVTSLDDTAFWIEGSVPGGYIELRAPGAATTRLPLASLAGPAVIPHDVRLPAGEAIDGTVRGAGALVAGVTVILSRLIEDDARAAEKKEEELPLERLGEVVTGPDGRFRFDGLGRERYQLLAVHPAHGRAQALVTPPVYPRLQLEPRAVIRGRVLENGIPVAAADVRLLPSLEAVAAARNPILLATEAGRTGPDGRFQVIAPDEGLVVLAVGTGRSSQRIDLGDAASLGKVVDVGDIKLEDPRELDVFADVPDGCRLQTAGPLGVAGMSIIAPAAVSRGHWRFAPPAGGRWLFAAICGRDEIALEPAVVDIRPGRREPIVLKVRR
ncbi:MAG TPA: hypothetical protein VMN81_09155 [Vicinamibacterales bacterium]|nr:hypothetical protein [Vicinamibacterales bacterium]